VLKNVRQAFQNRFRRRRYRFLEQKLGIESTSGFILDLGGGPASFFASFFPHPHQVILLEIEPHLATEARQAMPGLQNVIANGEQLPFGRNSIALTICNSVIEHVTDPEALAQEIERVSQRYFVQTPDGRFPLEPHSYLPIPFYYRIPWRTVRYWLCRLFKANFDYVESVDYLSEENLRQLFPQASLSTETVLGLTKSFYLIKQ